LEKAVAGQNAASGAESGVHAAEMSLEISDALRDSMNKKGW
jgi:hypothetical protein